MIKQLLPWVKVLDQNEGVHALRKPDIRILLVVNAAVRANAVVPARSHARAAESPAKLSAAARANAVVPVAAAVK